MRWPVTMRWLVESHWLPSTKTSKTPRWTPIGVRLESKDGGVEIAHDAWG